MEDTKTLEQRLEKLEASVRSFASTYAVLEKVLEKAVVDVQELGSGLRETARLFDGFGYGWRTEPLKDSANAAKRISESIKAALDTLDIHWYGSEWKDALKKRDS